jgi:HAD superfamily hydrolase (TIGR01549 family)
MAKLLTWLRSHNQYDVYSFDVFDTLLRRRIDPPELIKGLAAEYLSTRLAQHGIAVSPDKILAQRSRCEELLLGEALSRGGDADYRLDDVMTETLKALSAASVVDSREAVSHEVELEKKAAQPMPGAVAALRYLKSAGKRVICMSDSYLSANQMAAILEHQNLMKYIDKLYVSCEIGKRKSTGRLFQHVLETEGSKLVHIGDNYTSDYIIPKRLGIEAPWLHSRSEQKRKSELRKLRDGKNKMDYVNAIVRHADEGESALYRVGYKVLGPALTVFVHNVAEQARKDGVEALFFIARDGYAMKKIYEALQRTVYAEAALPPGRYMCLGRLPVRLASLHELTLAEMQKVYGYIARFQGRSVSLGDIMGSYGLEPGGFIGIAKQCGLDLDEAIINPAEDERLRRLVESEDFQRMVREKSNEAKRLLRDYLAGIGFMGKRKVAVVDANAEGLTQSILDTIFSDDTGYPAVRRYYFNLLTLNVDTASIQSELSDALGIVTDWRSDSSDAQAPFRLFGLLLELFCHPNHGVTVGYRRVGEKVVPIFRKTPQEAQYHLTSQGLQGILAYARDYGAYYGLHNYTGTQLLRDMKTNVRRWVSHPPKMDAETLKDLVFTSDWPIETNHRLIEQISAWDVVTIVPFRRKVGGSAWPEGTVAASPASGFSRILWQATNCFGKVY